jgi:hypothetical protein
MTGEELVKVQRWGKSFGELFRKRFSGFFINTLASFMRKALED